MEKRKSQTMMKKLIACSIAVIMCMVTCLAPLGVNAASDLMVPATFYTEAYNATNGSNKLDVDSTGLVLRQGDWIKYGINIAEAGVYNVSMDVLVDGTRTQNYKVSLDDVVKIENGSGLVEAGGWKTIELGTINITKSGAQTLKIENIGYWSYVRSIKLTYVSGINYDIEIPVTKYAEGYKASDGSGTLQADGTALVMSNGDWGKYNIDVLKEGQYKVTLDALVDGTRNQSFAVALNDAVKIENASVLVEAGGWKNIELGTISITKTGAQTLKLTSTGTYWTYASNLKLVYVGELNYDIEIPMSAYKEGYKASDGSGTLQTDGAALVMSNGDWAKYNIDVLKEGQYKVTLDALVDGTRNQYYSVETDGITKIASAEVMVEAGGWRNVEIGTINITKEGVQTLKIANSGVYWAYANNLKLTYVGELDLDVEIPMTTYKEGYKASDGSGVLTSEGAALIMYAGDWAKYDVEFLKTGQYKVTLDALVDGTRNQNFAISVDGVTKLANAEVMVEAGGWKNIELGTINITEDGVQSLKIANSGAYWTYAQNLKLTYAGELEYDIEIPVTTYKEGYKASDGSGALTSEGAALIMYAGDWAKYDIEALKAGQYKVTLDALVDGTRNQNFGISVDDVTKLANAEVMVEAGGWKTIEVGTINITKDGVQTLKIENTGAYWTYVQNLKLTYVGELNPDVEINMTSYNDANNASGGNALTVEGSAVVIYQNEWAKYNIDILKPGKYNVSMDILVDADRYQKYTISADDALKDLYVEVLAKAGGFKNYDLGSIYFAKSGLQTLKFANEGFWSYVQNLKLTYAGDLNATTIASGEEVEIDAKDYAEGYDASENSFELNIENESVCFGSGDWAEYIVDAKAEGIYNVKTAGSACDTEKALVNVSANGKLYSSQDFGNSFSEADNYVYLENGMNVLKIENPGENDFDLKTLTLSRVGGMTSAGGVEQSVDADFSEVLAQGERLAFGINADANGVYKIRALINDSAKTDVNVYVNDVPVSVISIPYSETDSEYYAFVRLDSGKNIIKLKALDGDVDIDDIKVAFQTSATDEELDEVSLNVQNAKNEDEIKAILSESSAVSGADIETLTNGIQYEKYVYTRLLGRTYTDGTDLLDAIYNTVAFEKATPSLATSVSGGVLKVIALTDIYESDGMIIAAIYKDGRMLGMNASPYVRGEKAEVSVSGYIDGATIKVFSVDSLNNISPIEISGGVYKNIYVSSSAEINGNGTELNPYRSLKEAKNFVEELNGSQTGDIVVNIMPGYYELDETEVFTEADGANGDNKIIYRGTDKNNMPIISGGKKVTGWSSEGNGIYSADFSGDVRNLYVGGFPAQRARSNRAYTLSSQNGNTMTATINDISSFAKPSDLVLVWPCEWAMHYTPVENVSISKGVATFSMDDIFSWTTRSNYTDIGGYHSKLFYIENALELLDSEGEFYYDKSAGKIYYKPFAEEDLNDCYVSRLDAMMEIEGTSEESKVSNIVFENLDFRYGSWNNNAIKHVQSDQYITNASGTEYSHIPAQININYADNISFTNCRFSCMGSTAIAMRDAATNISMSGNVFKDLGGGAVSIGSFDHNYEATEGDNCSQIKFTDNVVRRTSQVYGGVPALAIYYENNIEILRNDISDLPYTAISAGWGWGAYSGKAGELTISKNRIYSIMDSLNDGAHIYTLGDLSGTVISENYMYDTDDGRGGVYNDTGSAGMDILSNVIDVYIPSKDTYWWVLNQLLIKNINAHGNFAHSSGDIYESAIAQNVTQSDNNNIKGNGSWDGLGNEKAQSIIDNAGISASYSSLLDLANTPSWRNDPTALN